LNFKVLHKKQKIFAAMSFDFVGSFDEAGGMSLKEMTATQKNMCSFCDIIDQDVC
jgi:hypothetical protein